jgi:hypothetical protein
MLEGCQKPEWAETRRNAVKSMGDIASALIDAQAREDERNYLGLEGDSGKVLADGMNAVIDMIRARGEDLHAILETVSEARNTFEELELDDEILQDLEGELGGTEEEEEEEEGDVELDTAQKASTPAWETVVGIKASSEVAAGMSGRHRE